MTNPNFPTMEYGWGAMWNANGGDVPLDRYVDLTERTQDSASTQRGRQYELDQVQSGTFSGTLTNVDGALDPTNGSGPWSGHIGPYQPFRLRAQWPPTANLLTPALAECSGLSVGAVNQGAAGIGMFGLGLTVVSATGYSGAPLVFQRSVASGFAANTSLVFTMNTAVAQGGEYSVTLHARNVTPSTTIGVRAFIAWAGPIKDGPTLSRVDSAPQTLVGSASAGWTALTVTGTMPDNAYGAYVGVCADVTTTSATVLQTSAWQVERGTPTPYGTPGTWYAIYGGYVERWPQGWTMSGSLGNVQPTAVDSFALLSQRILDDPLTHEINKHSPSFLYRFDDPQGSDSAVDATGNYDPAPVRFSKYGKGSLSFGNEIESDDPGEGFASDGTVLSIANPSPGTNLYSPASLISLSAAGVVPPSFSQDFTRIIAFRYTGPVPTTTAAVWMSSPQAKSNNGSWSIQIQPDQGLWAQFTAPNETSGVAFNFPGGHVCDGDWHLAYVTFTASTQSVSIGMDGNNGGSASIAAHIPTGMVYEFVGGWADGWAGTAAVFNYQGDLAYCASFPSVLSNSDLNNIYAAWKTAFAGDSTDQRYNRILDYAGYIGQRKISAGDTTNMGPMATEGQDALSSLQEVVDTENGEHFADAGGAIVFRPRSARYNTSDPVYTFGENVGEWPYEDVQLDYDPTHLGNIARVTQASTGAVFTAQDADSQTAYFPRTLERTSNAADPIECQSAAGYLVSRYSKPLTRIASLTLHPSALPSLWPVALSLELGMRIRIIRRPPGRPPITIDAFVEQIQWSFTDQNDAVVTLQCSPADLTPYGVIQAWHTTLTATANAGTSTLTVDTSSANTAQLQKGYTLVVGTENVTVLSTSGATIHLVSSLFSTHIAGARVTEPLSDPTVDPATWDGACVFDSVAFTY